MKDEFINKGTLTTNSNSFKTIKSKTKHTSHVMELLHDIVERILEILPLKSLLRFKSVSKQWKSMIEAPYFQKKLLICRQSQDPDFLIINPLEFGDYLTYIDENVTRMFTTGSSDLIKLPNLCPSA